MSRFGSIILFQLVLCAGVGAFAEDTVRTIRDLSGFDAVANTTAAEMVIRPGGDYSVRAHGSRRALNRFRFDVSGGELRIRNPWRPWYIFAPVRADEVLVEVSMPDVSGVELTGSGDATIEGSFRNDRLVLRTTGSGGISAEGVAVDLEVSITGSGDIDFSGRSDRTSVALSGSGKLRAELQTQTLKATITGSGDLNVRGSAEDLDLRMSSSGRFEGGRFVTETADVTQTGSGDVILTVQSALKARLSGSGDVRLIGGTPSVDSSLSGSGRVLAGP